MTLISLQCSAILSKVVIPNTIAAAEIGDGAASAVEQRVLGWCRSHKDATVAEKREAAKLIMEGFVQAYDDKAAEFASQWYDYRTEQGGARLKQAVTMTVYEPGSVDDVARLMGMSRSVYFKKIKALTGIGPNDYFKSLRLQRAAELLDAGELSITEISYRIGITDSHYFSKCFKQKFGVTPTEYRNR